MDEPMPHRFRACLFDLDGTLVETAPDLCRAANHALAAIGRPTLSLDQVRHMIGDGARALLVKGLTATGGTVEAAELQGLVDVMLAYYADHIADESRPFPGVAAALDALRGQGVRLAVVTNKPGALTRLLLDRLGMLDGFDAIVGGDELPVRKPHPGHVTGTLHRLGVPAWQSVLVGDSHNDVAAGHAAGVPVVAVSFGYTTVPARELSAEAVIDHFDELAGALSRLG